MSLSKNTKNKIKLYILELVELHSDNITNKVIENFNISKNSVYRYIKELLNENKILRLEKGKYKINPQNHCFTYDLINQALDESKIFHEDIVPLLKDVSKNVFAIWEYCFTEMFNNIIDHSNAKKANVIVSSFPSHIDILLFDNGVGIFNKIAKYYNFSSISEAISNLFKGKLTTDSTKHTGEGIFFTSQILDKYSILSDNEIFSRKNNMSFTIELNNLRQNNILKVFKNKKGTLVYMSLFNNSNKNLKEVFNLFEDENSKFTITRIPLKNLCANNYFVSRSQAKRIYFGLNKFETVIFDFDGIEDIYQGFAHELFVVFLNNNPSIKIEIVNANANVQKMLRHVGFIK